jgi:hypothetical protein
MIDEPATPHRWIAIIRRKLRERGYSGATLEHEFQKVVSRVPRLFFEPHTLFCRINGRDNLSYCVWKNPTQTEFMNLVHGTEGSRAILTEPDLYCWQSPQVSHSDFVQQTGIDGIRLALRPPIGIAVNHDPDGLRAEFPWAVPNGDKLDMVDRRRSVEEWLRANPRLTMIQPIGFVIDWYI